MSTYEAIVAVNVRAKPAIGAPLVSTLDPGDRVQVEEIVDGWARIDGGMYVNEQYIRPVDEDELEEE